MRSLALVLTLSACVDESSPTPDAADEPHACEALPYGENSEAYEACELASHHSYPVTCTTTAAVLIVVDGTAIICKCADVPCLGPP